MLGAMPQTRLAAANTANPNRYDARGPTRIRTVLTNVAATTDPTRYSVVTQA